MPDPIRPVDAARILMRASAIDNRDPSAAADEMWSAALTSAGVEYDDCIAAVAVHYGRSPDRLMPAHLVAIARELRSARREVERNRAAIAGGDPRPGSLDPSYVKATIQAAVDQAQAKRRAREEAASKAHTRPCGKAPQPDDPRCPGVLTFDEVEARALCPVCRTWTYRYAPPPR